MTALRLIDALLVVALVLVVPLSLRLSGARGGEAVAASAAGVVTSISFLFDEGTAAAAFVLPWGATTTALAWRQSRTWRQSPREGLPEMMAFLFLLGGAGWLTLSRYGSTPLGFGPTIVELTAVHFHYAGFVASIVTVQLMRWLERAGSPRSGTGRVCVYAVLVATPVTAAGITFATWLGAAGASLFALALSAAATLTITSVIPRVPALARRLLWVSALSVLVPMVLAVAFAFGRWLPTPSPSLRTMVWTHGLLNALGFALCGVLGWLAASRDRRPDLVPAT